VDSGNPGSRTDPRKADKVRAIFAALSKYIHAKQIYASNNPNLRNFASAYHESFRTFFADEKELSLTIEQYRINWRDEVVYDNEENAESLAFLLYKDGIGEIIFQSSVTPSELEQLVDLITNEIFHPSAHTDIVSRLWQLDFASISYRVFDEDACGSLGQGGGSGTESREQPLRVNDHPYLPGDDDGSAHHGNQPDNAIASITTYFDSLAERSFPGATTHEKEEHLQNVLESFFSISTEEQALWRDEFVALNERNKLLWFLDIMLDFTQKRHPPPVVRDILDIIERLVHYIAEDAHIPTLFALLDIQKTMESNPATTLEFQDLAKRMRHEITNSAFLLSLGNAANRPLEDVRDLLRYFQCVGKNAVPGVCELLANLKDGSMHKEACDTLIAIAPDDMLSIVNGLNLDNPQQAMDAVYLISRSTTGTVPPIMSALLACQDAQVRGRAIEYLAQTGNDEAVSMLVKLLEDPDVNTRTATVTAVEGLKHPLIVDKVTALCFTGDAATKDMDELEHMFRAAGRLAGENMLPQLKQMTKKHGWLSLGKNRIKQNKLLSITALRSIPGRESYDMLSELSRDGDTLVRTKALYVLKQMEKNKPTSAEDPDFVLSGKTR